MDLRQNTQYHSKDLSGCTKTSLQEYVYNYPWEQVVSSYMNRFPKHSLLPVLINSEVLSDKLDDQTQIRTIVRRAELQVDAPLWFKKAIGVYSIIFIQNTIINFKERSMRIINYNESFKDRALFGDDCIYKSLPETDNLPFNQQKSKFEQYGFFQLPKFPLVKTAEKMMAKSYGSHTSAGRELDIVFIKESIAAGGTWDQLTNNGQNINAIVTMPVEKSKRKTGKKKQNADIGQASPRDELPEFNTTQSSALTSSDQSKIFQLLMFPWDEHSDSLRTIAILLVSSVVYPITFYNRHPIWIYFLTLLHCILSFMYHIIKFNSFWIAFLGNFQESKSFNQDVSVTDQQKTLPIPEKSDFQLSNKVSNGLQKTDSTVTQMTTPLRKSSLPDIAGIVDEDSSVSEADVNQNLDNEQESEIEYETDEDEIYEDEYAFNFFSKTLSENNIDQDLGDLSQIKLRDIKISVPVFINRSITTNNLYLFAIEVVYPNGFKRTVERLYTDFIKFRKFCQKTIPQCKVQLTSTYLPLRKKSDPTALGMALDNRRIALETYLRQLLLDEAIAKLGYKILIQFLKFKGPLFPPNTIKETAKKRIFGSSFSTQSTPQVETLLNQNIQSDNVISGILLKARWRSCLKEVKVQLDKQLGIFSIQCNFPVSKSPHCQFAIEEIKAAKLKDDKIPVIGEKYIFIEIQLIKGESLYFCAKKEIIDNWVSEFKNILSSNVNKQSQLGSQESQNLAKRLTKELSITAQKKLILNQKQILFRESSQKNPCAVITDLLGKALNLFQEYTNDKCIMTARIQKLFSVFQEEICQLQVISLQLLETDSQKLSFWINVYHTLVIHSHLEFNFDVQSSSLKRLRIVFRAICYDINSMVFSLQDIEHSILRAKMSRYAILKNNPFSSQQSPRFTKNDPRIRYALQKPDLRINFVLNSGSKSSIYNIWIFSSDEEQLNKQLDHASTHFINEQFHIDLVKKIVYLPRICQYFSGDLGGNKARILKTLIMYMSPQMEKEVKWLFKNEKSRGGGKIKLRYQDYDSSIRGVFFKGHDIGLIQNGSSQPQSPVCPLYQQQLQVQSIPAIVK